MISTHTTDFRCTVCDKYNSDEIHQVETPQGEYACIHCQDEASTYFGQDGDNIRHTRIMGQLIDRWINETTNRK